ncbi:MAG: SpoIVB peptidase [Bacteroidales bacterium]|nr:SpoIVB peptidase [Lachnoclostridium sp.]MCM1385643.1 SpoIVB peptidase [Lachnoclostridium sp.]MCM1465953.1 SpoIVB peptidase [Bacteroidales bacterium]
MGIWAGRKKKNRESNIADKGERGNIVRFGKERADNRKNKNDNMEETEYKIKTSGEIKKQSGEDAVIFISNWKSRIRKYRIYRACLCGVLVTACVLLASMGYYSLDNSIPSYIYMRAGEEQQLNLGVPAKAEVLGVSVQGKSNIPKDAVTIDLNRSVTLKMGEQEKYQLQVKLFGIVPFKQMEIQVIQDEALIPVGVPVGIYMKTDGILVIGVGEFAGQDGVQNSPAKYILKSGDYIRKIDGANVTEKDEFIKKIKESGGREVILTVERDGELIEQRVTPRKDQNGVYKIGVWIRDNAQGVGTMTYLDSQGNFGALGHGINDLDTSTLMNIHDGTLYQTEIVSLRKGVAGNPGEMTGRIIYADDRILGDITGNNIKGIYGNCNEKGRKLAVNEALPIGFKQEIEKGAAQILCTVDGDTKYYDIEITAVHLDHDNVNRGIELTVTDPELLELTGGIIQGMSGSPIVQNGKFIGAVTHVLVQDPARGYGIFIEEMIAK